MKRGFKCALGLNECLWAVLWPPSTASRGALVLPDVRAIESFGAVQLDSTRPS